MKQDKFESEAAILKSFFETYCSENGHAHKRVNSFTCKHNGFSHTVELSLCRECQELSDYSFARLEECPHEIKPRCRSCKNPCYEKSEWKKVAKVMRYSGLKLGLLKVKRMVKSIFTM